MRTKRHTSDYNQEVFQQRDFDTKRRNNKKTHISIMYVIPIKYFLKKYYINKDLMRTKRHTSDYYWEVFQLSYFDTNIATCYDMRLSNYNSLGFL